MQRDRRAVVQQPVAGLAVTQAFLDLPSLLDLRDKALIDGFQLSGSFPHPPFQVLICVDNIVDIDRGAEPADEFIVLDQWLVVYAMPPMGAVVAPQPNLDDVFTP
jgi:hypothetical protein